MTSVLRRWSTFLLLLAIPLRVYAAAAMMFCGQPGEATPPPQTSMHEQMQSHSDPVGGMAHAEHHQGHGTGSAHGQDHGSCSACCCAGMIATATHDWQAQPFARPAPPRFVAMVVPPTVPRRLERPPRIFLA